MKNQLLRIAYAMFFSISFLLSCSDDDDPEPEKSGTLTVNTDGSVLSFTSEVTAMIDEGDLRIDVKSGGIPRMYIEIKSELAVTTYPMGNGQTIWFKPEDGPDIYYSTNDGEIVITEIDEEKKTISGTYSAGLESADSEDLILVYGVFTDVPYKVIEH